MTQLEKKELVLGIITRCYRRFGQEVHDPTISLINKVDEEVFDYHDFYQYISNHNPLFNNPKMGSSINKFTSMLKGELRRHKNKLKQTK